MHPHSLASTALLPKKTQTMSQLNRQIYPRDFLSLILTRFSSCPTNNSGFFGKQMDCSRNSLGGLLGGKMQHGRSFSVLLLSCHKLKQESKFTFEEELAFRVLKGEKPGTGCHLSLSVPSKAGNKNIPGIP